jgi:hypothetical protein
MEPLSPGTTRPAAASSRMMPQIRAAVRLCNAPGSGPDTPTISPSGPAMTCTFIPCLRCVPEENGQSAATQAIGIKVPSITRWACPAFLASRSACRSLGDLAASSATVLVTYLQAVPVPAPNPAAVPANVSPLAQAGQDQQGRPAGVELAPG